MLNRAKTSFKRIKKEFLGDSSITSFDMHYHTKYSDGNKSIPQIVKKARKLGIGVAITDHNEIKGAIEIAKYSDVPSIPGIEVTTKEGIHTLFYFYSTEELSLFYNQLILPSKRNRFSLNISLLELLDYAKDFNTVIVAPHPYSISWMGLCDKAHKDIISKELLNGFDAIEVLNGENLHPLNLKAVKLSESFNKPISGGSDGHTLHELGSVLTYVKGIVSPSLFLDKLRRNETFVIGKESNLLSKAISQSGKIKVPANSSITYVQKRYAYIKKVITIH